MDILCTLSKGLENLDPLLEGMSLVDSGDHEVPGEDKTVLTRTTGSVDSGLCDQAGYSSSGSSSSISSGYGDLGTRSYPKAVFVPSDSDQPTTTVGLNTDKALKRLFSSLVALTHKVKVTQGQGQTMVGDSLDDATSLASLEYGMQQLKVNKNNNNDKQQPTENSLNEGQSPQPDTQDCPLYDTGAELDLTKASIVVYSMDIEALDDEFDQLTYDLEGLEFHERKLRLLKKRLSWMLNRTGQQIQTLKENQQHGEESVCTKQSQVFPPTKARRAPRSIKR